MAWSNNKYSYPRQYKYGKNIIVTREDVLMSFTFIFSSYFNSYEAIPTSTARHPPKTGIKERPSCVYKN